MRSFLKPKQEKTSIRNTAVSWICMELRRLAEQAWICRIRLCCCGHGLPRAGRFVRDKGGVFGNTLNGHIIRGLDDPDPDNILFRQIFLDTAMLARVVSICRLLMVKKWELWVVHRAVD